MCCVKLYLMTDCKQRDHKTLNSSDDLDHSGLVLITFTGMTVHVAWRDLTLFTRSCMPGRKHKSPQIYFYTKCTILSLQHYWHPLFLTHPVFVVGHIAEHIIQVEDASITVLQPVNLQPVTSILKKRVRRERHSKPSTTNGEILSNKTYRIIRACGGRAATPTKSSTVIIKCFAIKIT